MTIDEALKKLHDREINCCIQSFWDGQWTVKIGDELNGYKASSTEIRIEDVAQAIIDMADEVYPGANIKED